MSTSGLASQQLTGVTEHEVPDAKPRDTKLPAPAHCIRLLHTLRVYKSASSCSLFMSTVAPGLEGRTLNLFSSSKSSFNLAFCWRSLSIADLQHMS
jgi:hypothetical protein